MASVDQAWVKGHIIGCKVDNPNGNEKALEIPLTGGDKMVFKGEFGGHQVMVVYDQGDQYEGQATFMMMLDKVQSTIYDFSEEGHVGPINELDSAGVRFQCFMQGGLE